MISILSTNTLNAGCDVGMSLGCIPGRSAGKTLSVTNTDHPMGCLHDPANFQQTSSKRPAIHVYFEYICWTFAGSCKHAISVIDIAWVSDLMRCHMSITGHSVYSLLPDHLLPDLSSFRPASTASAVCIFLVTISL